jgi:hypothetical protein
LTKGNAGLPSHVVVSSCKKSPMLALAGALDLSRADEKS